MRRYSYGFLMIIPVLILSGSISGATKWHYSGKTQPYGTLEGGYTSWQWLNPLPQGNTLRCVKTLSPEIIYAAGERGTVLKTTNAGSTWSVRHFADGNGSTLRAFYFMDSVTAVAVGENGTILRTSDAGESWEKIPCSATGNLYSVAFADSARGVIVGSVGTVLLTSDRGLSWQKQPVLVGFDLNGVAFASSKLGFAVGGLGLIYKTTNAGGSWVKMQNPSTTSLRAISVIDTALALAVGNTGNILRTTDGGLSWTSQASGTSRDLNSVYFYDSLKGTACGGGYIPGFGMEGTILHTTDGGINWIHEYSGTLNVLSGVSFANPDSGIIVGEYGTILGTTDGGYTWKNQLIGTTDALTGIYFTSASHGIASGMLGLISSTNGGLSWNQIPGIPPVAEFMALSFGGSKTGMAVGWDGLAAKGVVFHTSDSGASWEKDTIPATDMLYGVYVSDDTLATAVGMYGTIIRTTDGGKNWSRALGSTHEALVGVAFSGSRGIAVGMRGTILLTTDAGQTWNSVTALTPNDLLCVCWADSVNATAVGSGGAILHSTDAGNTWNSQPSGTAVMLNGVSFSKEGYGTAVGERGTIIRTTNGGNSWIPWVSPSSAIFYWVQVIEQSGGLLEYITGSGGTILCAAASPLNPKTWTWTGALDSSWNDKSNWSPFGVPMPGDSVIIPAAARSPVIDSVQQQVVIASLNILAGGRLTITDLLPRFVVLGDVTVQGTLEVRPPAATTIIVGGSWSIQLGGTDGSIELRSPAVDEGFIPSRSTVLFNGSGNLAGAFYNLLLDSASSMRTSGNVLVQNHCTVVGNISLRSSDTVFIQAALPQALDGTGKFLQGTVSRNMQAGALGVYSFESSSSFIQLGSVGVNPVSVAMTAFPDTNPALFGSDWEVVKSSVDTALNTITADSVTHLSRWAFGIPRPTLEGEENGWGKTGWVNDTIPVIRRVYDVAASGGSGFQARLSLRYDQREVPAGVPEDSLRLLRLRTLVAVKDPQAVLPGEYALCQNYPNPFNPTTTIKYRLPVESRVSLRVFNLLGQLVATLTEGIQGAGSWHLEWNGSRTASGVYFYRLDATSTAEPTKSFTQVRKLMLVQ